MAHAIAQSSVKFQKFSKYDFVKSYAATAKNDEVRKEKEQEAALIADAIEETQAVLLENLATKEDLKALELSSKKDLEIGLQQLKSSLIIQLTAIMAALLTFLPLATDFIKRLF